MRRRNFGELGARDDDLELATLAQRAAKQLDVEERDVPFCDECLRERGEHETTCTRYRKDGGR